MLSARLRALTGLAPVVMLAGLLAISPLIAVSPVSAAQPLRILSPAAGDTVSGTVEVMGTAVVGTATAGTDADQVDISIALAPQTLVDCGAPVIERPATVQVGGGFRASIPTATLLDGVYCVVAVVANGQLSTAVGDITVRNGSMASGSDGQQRPTPTFLAEPLINESATPPTDAPLEPLADAALLAPLVLAAAATLALVVLVLGLILRRNSSAP